MSSSSLSEEEKEEEEEYKWQIGSERGCVWLLGRSKEEVLG
jgi:hypothetical protein